MMTTIFLQGNPNQPIIISGKNEADLRKKISDYLSELYGSNLLNCTNFFAGRSRQDGYEIDQVITLYLPHDAPESWTVSSNIFGQLFQSADKKEAITFFSGACVMEGEIYF